jgi:parvulin-like peptidyl-prolyl isomerase
MPTPQITSLDLLHQIKITGKIPELITGILQQRIVADHAHHLGIEITDAQVQVGADQFRATNQLDTIAATEKWLADRTLSMDDFEQLVITNLLTHQVSQQLFAHQVEPFFHQHILDYGGAIISEVVVNDYNLAIELFYAIQEGDMSFTEVARDYLKSAARSDDGYRGLVKRSQMPPEISAAVFAATPPQLLFPIQVATNVHLILVAEIVPPQLSAAIRQQILWDLFQGWLQEQVKQQRAQIDLHWS